MLKTTFPDSQDILGFRLREVAPALPQSVGKWLQDMKDPSINM